MTVEALNVVEVGHEDLRRIEDRLEAGLVADMPAHLQTRKRELALTDEGDLLRCVAGVIGSTESTARQIRGGGLPGVVGVGVHHLMPSFGGLWVREGYVSEGKFNVQRPEPVKGGS